MQGKGKFTYEDGRIYKVNHSLGRICRKYEIGQRHPYMAQWHEIWSFCLNQGEFNNNKMHGKGI